MKTQFVCEMSYGWRWLVAVYSTAGEAVVSDILPRSEQYLLYKEVGNSINCSHIDSVLGSCTAVCILYVSSRSRVYCAIVTSRNKL